VAARVGDRGFAAKKEKKSQVAGHIMDAVAGDERGGGERQGADETKLAHRRTEAEPVGRGWWRALEDDDMISLEYEHSLPVS